MRKLALSSSVYHRCKNLADAFHHVAKAGYSGVEVVADAPHGYPPLLSDADRKGIHSALAQSRLALSNIDAAPMTALRDKVRPSWIESDPVLRLERVQHTLDAAKLAKDLGAPSVSVLAGGEREKGMSREQAVRHFVAGLRQVAGVVAKRSFPPILIDPQPGLLVETVEQALDIVSQVPSPHVGISLNTASFCRAGQDVPAAIRQLKGALRHVHVEDIAARDSSQVVVPGTGVVDFAAVFAALDSVGYSAWLSVDLSGADVHPDDAARQALQFLRQFDK